MAIKGLTNLCPPAMFYLVISMFAIVLMSIQNYGHRDVYCLGYYECDVSSVYIIFLLKIVYIIFWTWILNLICGAGAEWFSWLLVFLPFILFFIMISSMFIM
uniref:Uncharacterized protein n=1 Tax=viral metagenome TaxID=1070528 RepID=A0A6C0DZ84_9ZZZZ